MIDREALLADLQAVLRTLEADLLERSDSSEVSDVGQALREEYLKAKEADRTAQSYEDWRSAYITQLAAAWVLSCVFARFLEDNALVDPPKIAGPTASAEGDGENRLQRARDEHELYFRQHPSETDREYLLSAFKELAQLAGAAEVFGEHNALWELPNWLSGDAAGELLRFFQKIDPDTGTLIHDFTDPVSASGGDFRGWDTRFLGDLYQDLSEAARKRYALLQTPEFVEQFTLDRTLDPALDTFGLDAPPIRNEDDDEIAPAGFRMIDPACGSGHFLLGAFERILERWRRKDPGAKDRELVQRALDSVHGVDVNPFAVAIARFRLLLAALKQSGITKLKDAPAFHFNLAAGDSLLHGATVQIGRKGAAGRQDVFDFDELAHHYAAEDADALHRILRPGAYHAVVANPPYITVKDRALSQAYRDRYVTCHMKYSLAVPFMERIFRLAVEGRGNSDPTPAGYTGQITANSFMKREFGKKIIEQFLPKIELTHVIDTSGAYIPGHGTPTVILFGRHRRPITGEVRTVMGIRGEPSTPQDPARGHVWSAILDQIDQPGSESEFVSVADVEREGFGKHPWSIGGGGAAELKTHLEDIADSKLVDHTSSIGVMVVTLEDDAYAADAATHGRHRIGCQHQQGFVEGDTVRDWLLQGVSTAIFPYSDGSLDSESTTAIEHRLWPLRTGLRRRLMFGKTQIARGFTWYEYGMFIREKYRTPLSIVFAFVATHNHFVLDRGGKVFNRSAPVIKLPADASKDGHLALLGLLNSSAACFWMKQVFHDKGSSVDSHGARQTTVPFENFREFTGTGLQQYPLPADRPMSLARELDALACRRNELDAAEAIRRHMKAEAETAATVGARRTGRDASLREALDEAKGSSEALRQRMIALQEELDWQVYGLYGLLEDDVTYGDDPPAIELGQRAFEIVMARKMAAGELETTWFQRHRSTPITEIPEHWPEEYRRLVERRIELIENDRNIGLIEQPEYKRRWNTEPWESQLERALREWLLDRLESYFDFDSRMTPETPGSPGTPGSGGKPTAVPALRDPVLISMAKLTDIARQDERFLEVGELYREDPAFDVQALVAELVDAGSVPLLPVLRYKATGLRKRIEWEKTWELQRAEDAIDARTKLPKDDPQHLTPEQAEQLKKEEIGDISGPPKYKNSDFVKGTYWRLRGKLDVPKERWVSLPHCEGSDGTLMIAWAGYDHLQLAQAIGAHYADVQERLGGEDDPRLVPLLACLDQLVPWLKQWHNAMDPQYNVPMGDYFEGFVADEARRMGLTLEQVRAWQPPKKTRGRKKRTKKKETPAT